MDLKLIWTEKASGNIEALVRPAAMGEADMETPL
jgi:hypothetical protein